MYLHAGKDIIIREQDIIGIFDLDKATVKKQGREYLTRKQKENKIINISDELPKSFIVCSSGGEEKVYLSQLSSATLLKRFSDLITSFSFSSLGV